MSSSSSIHHSSTQASEFLALINPLDYREVFQNDQTSQQFDETSTAHLADQLPQNTLSLCEHDQLIEKAKLQAVSECETQIRAEFEAKLSAEVAKITQAIDLFIKERKEYFSRVESEVIRLALSIAEKILHRETHADPMLIAAIVRIALDQLQEGSTVSLKVPLAEVEQWASYMADAPRNINAQVVGDKHLLSGHCILQANHGSIDFSIEAQLKEVEHSFSDLLAHRPILQ